MRVLVLDEWLPHPVDSGKRLRSFELLRRMARRHELTWMAPVEAGEPGVRARAAMEAEGFRVEAVGSPAPGRTDPRFYLRALASMLSPTPYVAQRQRSQAMRARARELHARQPFDLLHVEWTPLAVNRPRDWDRPWVVDAHNLEWKIWKRLAGVVRAPHLAAFYALEAAKMRSFERKVFREADLVLTVSNEEAGELGDWGVQACCVENGVDLERLRPCGEPEGLTLVFTGALDWQANQDAVEHFLADLWPTLRARLPGLRFQVVGSRPPGWFAHRVRSVEGVELHASVPDIRPYLAQAMAVVVPLRAGGGTRLKILEALAMEKAVVSTPVGAEGLELVPGEDLLLASTSQDWAEAVAVLAHSPERRRALGSSGRRRIQARYGWDTLAGKLEQAWLSLPERQR